MNRSKIIRGEGGDQLEFLHKLLHYLIGSYVIGWTVLMWFSGTGQVVNHVIWQVSSFAIAVLTVWLSITLSLRALVYWTTSIVIFSVTRSIVYLVEGLNAPLGVWLLVLSGISSTTVGVITVQTITGRFEGKHNK